MKAKNIRLALTIGLCALCLGGALASVGEKASAATVTELNLYDQEYTTLTSAAYPADEDYFAKRESITLGRGDNEASYAKALQVLVKGPFTTEGLGTYYSALTYDISEYDFTYFSVTVGNANCKTNADTGAIEYTNEILYRVMIDGEEVARSSHALAAFETERITCAIPDDAREIRLHAQSEIGTAHGECNWANPVLTNFSVAPVMETALTDLPVSGNNTAIGQEEYAIKSATLAQGTDQALTDANAITGAIHGDYGNNTWKFSADYDISDKAYNRLTVDAGMLFAETYNQVRFKILAIGGTHADLGISPVMDGTTYHHFDVEIPAGTTKIQFWAQSLTNAKEFGNLAWCNATLYTGGKTPVKLLGEVTCLADDLAWGGELPALNGNFTVEKATVAGEVKLDAGQELKYGTHEYTWTFTPQDSVAFNGVTGTIELTAGKRTLDLSGVSFADAMYDYDGTEKSLVLSGADTLPEYVEIEYSDNTLTAPGSTDAIVSFTITGEYADLYYEVSSLTATLTIEKTELVTSANAAKTYTKGSTSDLTFTLKLNAVNATIKVGETALTSEQYEIGDKTLTIKAGYLQTLNAGKYEFDVECEGGEFTLTLDVKEPSAPNTPSTPQTPSGSGTTNEKDKDKKDGGCSSAASAAGALALAIVGAVCVLKKRDRD